MTGFTDLFSRAPEIHTHAHGRINLIGEHTDYNGGYVLPQLIPQKTSIELSPRRDTKIRIFSEARAREGIREYVLGAEKQARWWLDYVQGITWILAQEKFSLRGFEARIDSNVPSGSGVSSSAALEVSILRALRAAFGLQLDDVKLALLAQQSENEFVGAHVGVMDQMVASVGSEDAALFLDTKTLKYRLVPMPADLEIAALHSGISHTNREGGYNERRKECERAAAMLHVSQLRELDLNDLCRLKGLPELERRRARHVITENARVISAVESLERKDLLTFGKLLNQSHISMRDDYDVSIPQIDLLVDLAQHEPNVYGARMTGGGFGGSIIIAAESGSAGRIAETVAAEYRLRTGRLARILMPV